MDNRSRPQRLVLVGKLILLLVVAILGGRAYHNGVLADNEKARTVTIEEYTAAFEEYRAELQEDEWPLWGHVAIVAIMVVGFFAVYELLGYAAGWLLAVILPHRSDTERGLRQSPLGPLE